MPRGRIKDFRDLEVQYFLAGWALAERGKYLLIPLHEAKRTKILQVEPEIKDVGMRGNDWIPVCVEHVSEKDKNVNLLFAADSYGRVYYPGWEEFLRGRIGKWDRYVDIPRLLRVERFDIWKIVVHRSRVYAIGVTSGPDIGAIWVMDSLKPSEERYPPIKGIDEAPFDIDFLDQYMFVATGRGGTIEVRSVEEDYRCLRELSSEPPFKPVRVRVCQKRQEIWVASYDTLLWASVGGSRIEGKVAVTNGLDCVNDFVFDAQQRRIYATCTYSNRIRVVDLNKLTVSDLILLGAPELERPCWIKTHGNTAYVLGHSNGKIWVIDLPD